MLINFNSTKFLGRVIYTRQGRGLDGGEGGNCITFKCLLYLRIFFEQSFKQNFDTMVEISKLFTYFMT